MASPITSGNQVLKRAKDQKAGKQSETSAAAEKAPVKKSATASKTKMKSKKSKY